MKKILLQLLTFAIFFSLWAEKTNAQVSREDSLNLISIYEKLDGDNWTNNTAWKTDEVSKWFGVTVVEGLVTQINLPNNNLMGMMPKQIGNLADLTDINFNNNNLSGEIPYELSQLMQLKNLYLKNNQLNGPISQIEYLEVLVNLDLSYNFLRGSIPNFPTTITVIHLEHNNFNWIPNFDGTEFYELHIEENDLTFDDFANAYISVMMAYTYYPQKEVKLETTRQQAKIDMPLTISAKGLSYGELNNINNSYQWYKGTGLLVGQESEVLTIASLTEAEIGIYHCEIRNSLETSLVLKTQEISVEFLTPIAGENMTVCDEFATLFGNDPQGNPGLWTTNGSAVINNPSSFEAYISNIPEGESIFTWTFNGESDVVTINRLPNLSTYSITAGDNITICSPEHYLIGATDPKSLNAECVGEWHSYNEMAVFINENDPNTMIRNLDLGTNELHWVISYPSCEGEYKASTKSSNSVDVPIIITLNEIIANAGTNQEICEDFATLSAKIIGQAMGSWSIVEGTGTFSDIYSPNSLITNLAKGSNLLKWTVSEASCSATDFVTVTNNEVIADAGADINLYSNISPIENATIILDAKLAGGETGTWTIISGNAIIENSLSNTSVVTGIPAGSIELNWSVISVNGCTASDNLKITSSNVITNAGAVVDWNNPDHWIPTIVPTRNDSIYLSNCNVTISGINAFFGSIRIGSAVTFTVSGFSEAKGVGRLSGGEIVIEQDVEKGITKAGKASLRIGSGGEIVIEQDVEKASNYNRKGLRVGSGGEIVIEQDVEKGTKGLPALLTIEAGKGIFLAASVLETTALMQIGNGGQVTIFNRTPLTKDGKFVMNPNLAIGSGGELAIIQNIAPVKGVAALRFVSGGEIVIEQDVEKSTKAVSARLRISGGEIVIEQDVEKASKLGRLDPNLLVRNGGEIIIEPNIIDGSLNIPVIKVAGGVLNLGSSAKVAGSARISSGEIVIEQDVEKSKASKSTPDMTVLSNGVISFFDIVGNPSVAYLTLGENMAISFMEGSDITVPDATIKAMLEADECSSMLDPIGAVDGDIILNQLFKANNARLTSPPVNGAVASIFSSSEFDTWGETLGRWKTFGFIDVLSPMKGFKAKFTADNIIPFKGKINIAAQEVNLVNTLALDIDKRGFNLVGNPYSAAIDWELVPLTDIETAIYTYDPITENFGIYQKGGYSLNNADQYINPAEGFFVKATAAATNPVLSFVPEYITHNIPGLVLKTPYKATTDGLKLSVSNATHSDQIILRFDDVATMAYDEGLDVFKLFAFNENIPQLYTLGENSEKLAINVSPTPANDAGAQTTPLNFKSSVSGSYTINVDEYNFTEKTIYLNDLKTNESIDLRSVKTYSFDWNQGDASERFTLSFNSTVGVQSLDNSTNISIYSNKNTVYISINEFELNTKVEIYNISGTKVLDQKITNKGISEFQLNQTSGNYFVRVISNNKTSVRKVFITQ